MSEFWSQQKKERYLPWLLKERPQVPPFLQGLETQGSGTQSSPANPVGQTQSPVLSSQYPVWQSSQLQASFMNLLFFFFEKKRKEIKKKFTIETRIYFTVYSKVVWITGTAIWWAKGRTGTSSCASKSVTIS